VCWGWTRGSGSGGSFFAASESKTALGYFSDGAASPAGLADGGFDASLAGWVWLQVLDKKRSAFWSGDRLGFSIQYVWRFDARTGVDAQIYIVEYMDPTNSSIQRFMPLNVQPLDV
jgi:hypothetical protein